MRFTLVFDSIARYKMPVSSSSRTKKIVGILSRRYGVISWWPGDTDEVMIGAILTQQTRWENVVQALSNLKDLGCCSIAAIHAIRQEEIEPAIRCTGFYRIKARRLKALAAHVTGVYGSVDHMAEFPTAVLRDGLLSVNGIGAETADSILCYGFFRPSFVIDAYTERMMQCAGIPERRADLKALFESVLPKDPEACRQTHAHIVEYYKEYCAKKRCETCSIANLNG